MPSRSHVGSSSPSAPRSSSEYSFCTMTKRGPARRARGPRASTTWRPSKFDEPTWRTVPFAHELVERAEGLRDRRDPVGPVVLVEVDPVGPQALQRRLHRPADVLPRAAVGPARRPHRVPNFVASTTPSRRPFEHFAEERSLPPRLP